MFIFILIVTGDKRKRQEVDSDLGFSEECILGKATLYIRQFPRNRKVNST